jgi:outer membrane lipoprotein-sorting protein
LAAVFACWRVLAVRRRFSIAFVLLALAAVLSALAATPSAGDETRPASSSDPALARVLEGFDAAQRETVSIVAGFTERKDLKLLERPLLSRGELCYHRPNQVRWEYLDPDRKVFVITEDRYIAYYPALKRAEEVPIKKFVGRRLFRFIGLGQSIEELGKHYEFRLAPNSDLQGAHLLILTPRKKRMRERMAEMKIWVDAETYLPRQLQYTEIDGDSTLLSFHDVRTNVEVAAGRFHIVFPKDVVVSETFNGFSLGEQSF